MHNTKETFNILVDDARLQLVAVTAFVRWHIGWVAFSSLSKSILVSVSVHLVRGGCRSVWVWLSDGLNTAVINLILSLYFSLSVMWYYHCPPAIAQLFCGLCFFISLGSTTPLRKPLSFELYCFLQIVTCR